MKNTTDFDAPISEQIWDMKYRFKANDGSPIDDTVESTWTRIADDLAKNESDPALWAGIFYDALSDWKYLPAGRITAGAGTGRAVTLFNCYVMGTIPDSMDGIFSMLREAALTMQQGGGIGYDFSPIRPKGSLVVKLGADASGPLTFMDCWDAMCRTVMSAGSRRGAMMGTMRCDHPDIEEFITAKQDANRFRMFNLSVLVTDPFMEAVKNDDDWTLVHKKPPQTPDIDVIEHVQMEGSEMVSMRDDHLFAYKVVKARDLWNKIMQSTYAAAEPGVIFIDRINRENNLRYCETIASTNPCGEQPLPPYGACLLGSVNLARLVTNAFQMNAGVDGDALKHLVAVAVRMMDNVVDVSNFPLPQQQAEATQKRRIGLGVTGLADALAMCGLRYGSSAAVARTEKWMALVQEAAYSASVELAKEKGAFPLFDADEYLAEGTHASTLPKHIRDGIREHGIRNALLTSIAPTGTISLYAGNVSSGIEPIFSPSYTRKVLQKDGSRTEEVVMDYAVSKYHEWRKANNVQDKELPDYFADAQTLTPQDHLVMQAAAQKYVDSSISKTINLPEDISFEGFEAVYMEAYESGCKGCTTYRPNEITGSVLSVDEKPKEIEVEANAHEWEPEAAEAHYGALLTERPDTLPGCVYKVKIGGDPAFYVTVADIEEDGQRRPFEVFVNTKNPEHIAWMTGLTRMVSAIFRRPHDSSFVVEELKNVFDPKGAAGGAGNTVRRSSRPSVKLSRTTCAASATGRSTTAVSSRRLNCARTKWRSR